MYTMTKGYVNRLKKDMQLVASPRPQCLIEKSGTLQQDAKNATRSVHYIVGACRPVMPAGIVAEATSRNSTGISEVFYARTGEFLCQLFYFDLKGKLLSSL